MSRRPPRSHLPEAGTALQAAGAGRWRVADGRVHLDAAARRLLGTTTARQPLARWLAALPAAQADALRGLLAAGGEVRLALPGAAGRVQLSGQAQAGAAAGLAFALPADEPAARDEFFAGISHELRTPLNAILGFHRLARDAAPEGAVHGHLENIEASARLMLRVVNDLLDLSRLEAGKLAIDTDQPLDLPALVTRVGRVAAGLRQERPIALHALVDAACPRTLRGDAGRIEQVLLNLVGNALKFTLRGMVVLHVKLRTRTADRVTVRVSVSDTGVGIELDQLDRIGRPFERAKSASPQRAAGTGLGLAVVQRLLGLHGTQLQVASVAGGGTTCWFDLELPVDTLAAEPPLAPGWAVFSADRRLAATVATQWRVHGHALAEAGATQWVVDVAAPGAAAHIARCEAAGHAVLRTSAAPAAGAVPAVRLSQQVFRARAAEQGRGAELAGLSVLVLEDNPLNQQVLGELLASLGARVVMTDDGAAARERVEREHFDVALLDIQLPGESGLDTARRLRRTRAGEALPLVFLSAHVGAAEQQAAQAVGALGWLVKPYEPADLLALLRRVPRGAAPAPPAPARAAHPVPPARLRRLFADTWPQQRRLLQGDAETLRRGVHSLRGSLALLGERDALQLAREVEEGLLAGRPARSLPLAELLARADAIAAG